MFLCRTKSSLYKLFKLSTWFLGSSIQILTHEWKISCWLNLAWGPDLLWWSAVATAEFPMISLNLLKPSHFFFFKEIHKVLGELLWHDYAVFSPLKHGLFERLICALHLMQEYWLQSQTYNGSHFYMGSILDFSLRVYLFSFRLFYTLFNIAPIIYTWLVL